MVKDAESHASEDKKRRDEIEAAEPARRPGLQGREGQQGVGGPAAADAKSRLDNALEGGKQALRTGDPDVIRKALDELNAAYSAAGASLYQSAQARRRGAPGRAGPAGEAAPKEDVVEADYEIVDDNEEVRPRGRNFSPRIRVMIKMRPSLRAGDCGSIPPSAERIAPCPYAPIIGSSSAAWSDWPSRSASCSPACWIFPAPARPSPQVTGLLAQATDAQRGRPRSPAPHCPAASPAPMLDLSDAFANRGGGRQAQRRLHPLAADQHGSRSASAPGDGAVLPRITGSGPQIEEGSGSGFIVSADGYILTNNHVVEGADKVTVVLLDHRSSRPRSSGPIPTPTSPCVQDRRRPASGPSLLGNSDDARVGEWVLAIGNPLGERADLHGHLGHRQRQGAGARQPAEPRPSAASRTSSRPTPPSIPATPAGRW